VTEEERDELGFLRILDGIIESASEFIRDDGPYEAPAHVMDMACAVHVREVYLEAYKPQEATNGE
jgi:hypothetical protein